MSEFFKVSNALRVISSRFPIGVETIYKLLVKNLSEYQNYFIGILYTISFNSNLLSDEKNNILKVGLLAPLSGPHSEIAILFYTRFSYA